MVGRVVLIAGILVGVGGCSSGGAGPARDVAESSGVAAAACAAKLPAAAGIIYRDAVPDVHAETNMESLLRVKVMMLIVRDQIRRSEARPAAERAAECLELLQH